MNSTPLFFQLRIRRATVLRVQQKRRHRALRRQRAQHLRGGLVVHRRARREQPELERGLVGVMHRLIRYIDDRRADRPQLFALTARAA